MTLYQVPLQGSEEITLKLTDATATTILEGTDADGAWFVPWLQCNENAGGTPSLTVDLYDIANTTAYLLGAGGVVYNAKALTAGQSVTFSEGITVPIGWRLRAKSSDAAGKIDIVGTKARRLG